jgi:hypothetical protein
MAVLLYGNQPLTTKEDMILKILTLSALLSFVHASDEGNKAPPTPPMSSTEDLTESKYLVPSPTTMRDAVQQQDFEILSTFREIYGDENTTNELIRICETNSGLIFGETMVTSLEVSVTDFIARLGEAQPSSDVITAIAMLRILYP